jgi:hypothetical protein
LEIAKANITTTTIQAIFLICFRGTHRRDLRYLTHTSILFPVKKRNAIRLENTVARWFFHIQFLRKQATNALIRIFQFLQLLPLPQYAMCIINHRCSSTHAPNLYLTITTNTNTTHTTPSRPNQQQK